MHFIRFFYGCRHLFSTRVCGSLRYLSLLFLGSVILAGAEVEGRDGQANQWVAAATVHPVATRVALDVMEQGGNAVDAAAAAGLVLGVVDGHNSGIGGGCFMVIHLADGEIVAIDGRETAPQAARRDMYVREGEALPTLSRQGALASGVPGALAAYTLAVTNHGQLSLSALLEKAAVVAEQGFEVNQQYAQALQTAKEELWKFPASKKQFLNEQGQLPQEGERLKLPELARSYRSIARHGTGWFYKGPFAEKVENWMEDHGGLLTRHDFASYKAKYRKPVRTSYREFDILGFPPPSSGGVHVAQILNILERFDIKSMGWQSADMIHVTAEAMKRAFADRAYWLGDPDFEPVPRGLVSKEYAGRLAHDIRLDQAGTVQGHGAPPAPESKVFGKEKAGGQTTHFSVADSEGNWVACTATINTTFGSKVVIPETGIVMNNEMDDFAAQPGIPNFFGLVGAEANAIEPGKRPLSSMSPTLVLREGEPFLAIGAAGGPTIISQVVIELIGILDFELSPKEALAAPRFHHQWKPDELRVESSLPAGRRQELRERGHRLRVVEGIGISQAVMKRNGLLMMVRDPRLEIQTQTDPLARP